MNDFKYLFISRGVRWALLKIYDEAFGEPLTIFAKTSITDVWQCSKYASDLLKTVLYLLSNTKITERYSFQEYRHCNILVAPSRLVSRAI